MDSRKFWLITTAIFLLTAVRVGTTWRVFAPVVDEPTHIAAGRMWWAGVPAWEALNPPLAKILFAVPYRSQPVEHADDRLLFPTIVVFGRADVVSALARARLGTRARRRRGHPRRRPRRMRPASPWQRRHRRHRHGRRGHAHPRALRHG